MNLVDFLSQLTGKILIEEQGEYTDILFRGDVGELYGFDNEIDVDFSFGDGYGRLKDYDVYEAYASSNYIVIHLM